MPAAPVSLPVTAFVEEMRLTISKLGRRIRAQRTTADISDGQVQVLFILAKRQPLTLTELAALENVTPPSMNRTVNALVELGLVSRTPAPDDGRKALLAVTAAGAEMVRQTQRRRNEWFADRYDALDPDERAALDAAVPVLRKLADS